MEAASKKTAAYALPTPHDLLPRKDNLSLSSRLKAGFRSAFLVLLVTAICYTYLFYRDNSHTSTHVSSQDTLIPISCTREADSTPPCLVERPCGLVLLAQMYNPNLGALDPWMIHGLWGNFCNGSYYPTSCDPSREHHDIPGLLGQFHQQFLLNYMQFTWKNDPSITKTNGSAADLWAHEWNKHGTCFSTLYPDCYTTYQPGQEVADYFTTTVRLARTLPTSRFLENCGITPSNEKTYALTDVLLCLAEGTGGFTPRLGCSADGVLNEVWYYYHWEGSVRRGQAVGTDSTSKTSCPEEGIKYLPKAETKVV